MSKFMFQNFIRIENEHIGRNKDRFPRIVKKQAELIEKTAAFRQKL